MELKLKKKKKKSFGGCVTLSSPLLSVGVVGLECVVPRVKRPLSNPCIHLLRSVSSTSSGWDCPESPPLSAEEGTTPPFIRRDNYPQFFGRGVSRKGVNGCVSSLRLRQAALAPRGGDHGHRGAPGQPLHRTGHQHRRRERDAAHQHRDPGGVQRRGHCTRREAPGWGPDSPGQLRSVPPVPSRVPDICSSGGDSHSSRSKFKCATGQITDIFVLKETLASPVSR